jgi:hypothetical protein
VPLTSARECGAAGDADDEQVSTLASRSRRTSARTRRLPAKLRSADSSDEDDSSDELDSRRQVHRLALLTQRRRMQSERAARGFGRDEADGDEETIADDTVRAEVCCALVCKVRFVSHRSMVAIAVWFAANKEATSVTSTNNCI